MLAGLRPAYCDGSIQRSAWSLKIRGNIRKGLKEATDKGAQHIARYYHHEKVQFDGKDDDTIGNVRRGLMKTCGRTTFRQKSSNKLEAETSGSLEKTVASRSQSRRQSRSNSRNRSSDSAHMATPLTKRSCSSLRSMDLGKSFHNRVHRRVITRDPGRPIQKASSRLAVITGLIGAISGKYAHQHQ